LITILFSYALGTSSKIINNTVYVVVLSESKFYHKLILIRRPTGDKNPMYIYLSQTYIYFVIFIMFISSSLSIFFMIRQATPTT